MIKQSNMISLFQIFSTIQSGSYNNNKLITQQLKKQTSVNNHSISITKLIQKHNPSHTISNSYAQLINSMQTKYYDSSLIKLQNDIEFYSSQQALKRFYFYQQYHNKIIMLSQYYKYHNDQPRFFLQDLSDIIDDYQSQKRQLEYQKVKQKIQQQKILNQQKYQLNYQTNQNHHDKHSYNHDKNTQNKLKHMNSKKNINNYAKPKTKKSQKILKNIQLSYVDFQNKPIKNQQSKQSTLKKEKQMKRKTSSSNYSIKQKTMQKSNSLNYKNLSSTISDQYKSKQTTKIDNNKNKSNKLFNLKNTEYKQTQQLQSKYKQMISQLFKKKRSSSKNTMIDHKLQNKIHQNNEQKSKQNQQAFGLQSIVEKKQPNQQKELKKISRSRSQATLNICQSNKLIKTIKSKLTQKPIPLPKPISHFTSKQNSKHKYQQTNQKTIKNSKFSSTKSLKQKNNNIIQKPIKTVKIFQINKKDLVIDHGSKNSSVQKENLNEKKQQIKQKHHDKLQSQRASSHRTKAIRHDNKQNRESEQILSKQKKRVSSSKHMMDLNQIGKKKEPKKVQKQGASVTMFGRVIKTKIRG